MLTALLFVAAGAMAAVPPAAVGSPLPAAGAPPAAAPPPAAAAPAAPRALGIASVPTENGGSPGLALETLEAPPPPPPARPRFDLAVGLGMSFDSSGLVNGRTVPVPAFQLSGGIGSGLAGLHVRLLSTQASGRYHDTVPGPPAMTDAPVDRIAVDVGVAVRPLGGAKAAGGGSPYVRALLGSLAVTAAASAENASTGQKSTIRVGAALGAQVDVPIFLSREREDGYIGLRLGVRRLLAGKKEAGTVEVGSTLVDAVAGLVIAF